MTDTLKNLNKDKKNQAEEIETKIVTMHGQEVIVRVFSALDRKRPVSMKTRGRQTSDYDLLSGRSEDEVAEIEAAQKEKEKERKK